MIDGARISLGGSLYQFMGVAGLAARYALNRLGTVVHEQIDMDAILRHSQGYEATGIQFKYSQETPPRLIERSELIEILDAFHRSTSSISEYNFHGYLLITNREFSADARLLYNTRGQSTPDSKLKPGGKKTTKVYKQAMKLFGDETQASKSRHAILAKLNADTNVIQESWVDQVRTFASRHGVLRPEFEDAPGPARTYR